MTLVILEVANFRERPYVGSGCCVVAAAGLIEDEFRSWPEVEHVQIDEARARVEIEITAAGRLPLMLKTLDVLGYPARAADSESP